MKKRQIAFWVVVAVIYGVFSGAHALMVGAHLDPIPEWDTLSFAYINDEAGQAVGNWDPLRDAILATNVRISQLNVNNDRTNRLTAYSYGFAAAIALACAYFTYRESRPH